MLAVACFISLLAAQIGSTLTRRSGSNHLPHPGSNKKLTWKRQRHRDYFLLCFVFLVSWTHALTKKWNSKACPTHQILPMLSHIFTLQFLALRFYNSMIYYSYNALLYDAWLYDAGLYDSLLCDAVRIGSFSTKLPLMKINQSGYEDGAVKLPLTFLQYCCSTTEGTTCLFLPKERT